MKKIYSFLFGALMAVPVFAQEEDVTHLIANPGFDEDLTFQVDGSAKAYTLDGQLSSRSHKWVAEDGTIYAGSKTSAEGNGNWKRTDITAPTYSVNGFLGQIAGWQLTTGSAGEWTYFGAVPYGLGPGTIGIADDNNDSWLTMPVKPEEVNTDDNKAALYLRAGWTNYAEYTQVVKLPCAQYRLEYWINNIAYATTDASQLENRCEIICRKDHFKDEEGINANGWEKHTIEFTPTAEFTIKMGFKSGNYGSGKNPILLIDGLKLYKIGEADEEELLKADLGDFIDSLTYLQENEFADYEGFAGEINDMVSEYTEIAESGELEKMEQAYKDIQAYIAKLNACLPLIEEFTALLDEANALTESETPYEGIDDFLAALEGFDEYLSSGFEPKYADGAEYASDDIEAAIEALKKAIQTYRQSQPASPEHPADYTYLVDNPTFAAQGKWYIGEGGGDQTIKTDKTDNEGNPVNCWNAWRNNLTEGASVSVQQDLVGLPNGKYTMTASLNTQDGCITNQHLYVRSQIAEASSPVLTVTGWDPCVWEELTTEPVIVVDGKLTIGAIGVGDGLLPSDNGGTDTDLRRGWFNMINVKLNYLGEASPEEIAEATAAKWAAAEAKAAEILYAADKAIYNDSVKVAKAANDFDKLNAAIKVADASIADYKAVTNGTLKTLTDSVFASANVNEVNKVAVEITNNYINSAAATYTYTSVYTAALQYYLNTLAPAIIKVETAIAESEADNAKAVLVSTLSYVIADLKNVKEIVPATSSAFLPEQVAILNKALDVAAKANIDYSDGADVTAYMTNPTCDNVNGWTVNKPVGDGNGVKTGQQYDGNGAGGYIDTYNSEAGTLRATMYQTLDVPNGTYKVSNLMRSSGTGAYLFATDKALVSANGLTLDPEANSVLALATPVATPNAKYGLDPTDAEGNSTGEEATIYTDTRGEIWMAAADRIIAATGAKPEVGFDAYEAVLEKNLGETTCPEGVDEADWAIFSANNGQGRGWFNNSLEIEVKNHVLVVGVTCDYAFVGKTAEEAFTGTWFSADNFKLTMVKAGDNAGWDPTTGVSEVATTSAANAIYTLTGAKVNALQKGLNIVVKNGKATKILVK